MKHIGEFVNYANDYAEPSTLPAWMTERKRTAEEAGDDVMAGRYAPHCAICGADCKVFPASAPWLRLDQAVYLQVAEQISRTQGITPSAIKVIVDSSKNLNWYRDRMDERGTSIQLTTKVLIWKSLPEWLDSMLKLYQRFNKPIEDEAAWLVQMARAWCETNEEIIGEMPTLTVAYRTLAANPTFVITEILKHIGYSDAELLKTQPVLTEIQHTIGGNPLAQQLQAVKPKQTLDAQLYIEDASEAHSIKPSAEVAARRRWSSKIGCMLPKKALGRYICVHMLLQQTHSLCPI